MDRDAGSFLIFLLLFFKWCIYVYASRSWCGRNLIPVCWSETRETLYHPINLTFSYNSRLAPVIDEGVWWLCVGDPASWCYPVLVAILCWIYWGMIMIYNHDLIEVTLLLAKCVNTFSTEKVEILYKSLSLG